MRSLALAWEQAKTALEARQQSSGRSTPRTSPRDHLTPDSASASPSGGITPPPPLPALPAMPGAMDQSSRPVIRHARSTSSPQISPCDSAYDSGGSLRQQQQQTRGASSSGGGGDAYNVSPRSHSEVYLSPKKEGLERAAASDGVDHYQRHPPVSSVGLAKLQVGSAVSLLLSTTALLKPS